MLIVYEGLFVFKTFNLVNINFTKASLRGLKGLERKSWALSQQRIFPFSSLLWSGEVIGKGRCVHLVCRFISFFTDTSHVHWRWTSPLFSFLLYNVIWGYFIPRYIWAILFLPALPEFFLWRYLWGFFCFFFYFRKLEEQPLHFSEWLFMVILAAVLHQGAATKLSNKICFFP